MPIADLAIRLCSHHENGQNGCINWIGKITAKGYGQIKIGSQRAGTRRSALAHRVSASIWKGFDLASPLCVCHHCDNPRCINPDHLFIGTRADNSADCKAKGRMPRGERQKNAKLTVSQVISMRIARERGITIARLAKQYGVGDSTVRRIVHRRKWTHIPAAMQEFARIPMDNRQEREEGWAA